MSRRSYCPKLLQSSFNKIRHKITEYVTVVKGRVYASDLKSATCLLKCAIKNRRISVRTWDDLDGVEGRGIIFFN